MAYRNIIAAATTQELIQSNRLCRLLINKTLVGAVTIYDNATMNANPVASYAVGTAPQSFEIMATLQNGLRIVTAGVDDITVVYNEDDN